MVDSIMYQEDGYVVLASNQPEALMTESELLSKLESVLQQATDLPADIAKYTNIAEQAKYVLENYCELNLDENKYLQWYVVRWEKK
jgi:hypothetical protein